MEEKKSIFSFANKNNYDSPFGDWVNRGSENPNVKVKIPIISFKNGDNQKAQVNRRTSIEFVVGSMNDEPDHDKFNIDLIVRNKNLLFFPKRWTNIKRGDTIKTDVLTKLAGEYLMEFKVNGRTVNALRLEAVFFGKEQSDSKSICYCRKGSFTSSDLKNIVTNLRKLDIRIISTNPRDERGNRTFLDKEGNVIPSTDRGREPKNSVGRNVVKEELSQFDELAEDDKKIGDRLFYLNAAGNNIKPSEANYQDFAKELNRVFKLYEINTCLRKIHFLTQIYQETQRFSTTYESSYRSNYFGGEFYRGHGMKQITHDYNYLRYYDYLNKTELFDSYMNNRLNNKESVTSFNERTENEFISLEEMEKLDELVTKVSTEIFYACDSAGWFWWKNNINQYADKDDIISVSAKVNNPSAISEKDTSKIVGWENKKKYYDLMKIVFNYEKCK